MVVKVKFQSETEVKDADIKIKDSCGGKGKCVKCLVKVVSGNLTEPTDREIKEGYRLACQTDVIDGEVIVEVVNNMP